MRMKMNVASGRPDVLARSDQNLYGGRVGAAIGVLAAIVYVPFLRELSLVAALHITGPGRRCRSDDRCACVDGVDEAPLQEG
jgi:hypothetical protein